MGAANPEAAGVDPGWGPPHGKVVAHREGIVSPLVAPVGRVVSFTIAPHYS